MNKVGNFGFMSRANGIKNADNINFKGVMHGENVVSHPNLDPSNPKYVVDWLRDNREKSKKIMKHEKKRRSLKLNLKSTGSNKFKKKKRHKKKRSNSISFQDLQ